MGVDRSTKAYRESLANGLAVPTAFGEDMIMEVIYESGGTGIAISEEEMVAGVKEMAASEGCIGGS